APGRCRPGRAARAEAVEGWCSQSEILWCESHQERAVTLELLRRQALYFSDPADVAHRRHGRIVEGHITTAGGHVDAGNGAVGQHGHAQHHCHGRPRRRRTAPALGRTQTQQIVDVAGRLFFARLLGQRRLALQVIGEQLLQGLCPAFLQRLERGLFLGLLARCFFGRLASLFLFGLFPSLFGGLLLLFFLLGLLARGDFRLTLLLCGLAFGLGLSGRLGLLLFLGLAQPQLLHFRLAGGGLLRL